MRIIGCLTCDLIVEIKRWASEKPLPISLALTTAEMLNLVFLILSKAKGLAEHKSDTYSA